MIGSGTRPLCLTALYLIPPHPAHSQSFLLLIYPLCSLAVETCPYSATSRWKHLAGEAGRDAIVLEQVIVAQDDLLKMSLLKIGFDHLSSPLRS
jgi:hypothetical protein